MKNKLVYILALTMMTILGACSQSGKDSGAATTTPVTPEEAGTHEYEADRTAIEAGKPEFTVDDLFQQQLAALFSSYVSLKEAFVASNVSLVKTEADKTQKSLNAVDMKLVSGDAHRDWMTYQQSMQTALDDIKSKNDIEAQRVAFSKLTEPMYKVIKAYGLGGSTAYYEYCPMAFNDKGGYWLSDNAAIRNPYFGDKMLKCGEVKETLQ